LALSLFFALRDVMEDPMRNYRDLKVWSKAYALSLELYKLSRSFPRDELYGLTTQLRRAATSIGANLAEGSGRRSNSEMARFIKISLGSASELDHHLLLCKDLGFLKNDDYQQCERELVIISKMLASLLSTIEDEIKLKAKAVAKG
jgi:four helix bundle protein